MRRFLFLPPVVGSYRFCSLRHASIGFFRELATMSFASPLVRAINAVCICCRTNSRFGTPLSWFVAVGKNSRLMCSVEISVCSAAHSNIISDSWITPAKNVSVFFDHCWKSSSRPENSFGRPRTFTSMRTRSVFPNLSCRNRICCHLSSKTEQLLLKLSHNLLIVVDIALLRIEVPRVLLLRSATQLLAITVQQPFRPTKPVHS